MGRYCNIYSRVKIPRECNALAGAWLSSLIPFGIRNRAIELRPVFMSIVLTLGFWVGAGGRVQAQIQPGARPAEVLGNNAALLRFSTEPTDIEIINARVFDEPLIPVAIEPVSGENNALAEALSQYASRSRPDDFSALAGFIQGFPDSRWAASLLLHLGVENYNSGRYSEALATWQQAWEKFKTVQDPKAKAQADRTLGELARLYSKLGRMEALEKLLDSAKDRPLEGPATALVAAARDSLWMMKTQPGFCFRCGPLALDRIRSHENPQAAGNPLIMQSQSTTNGFSLSQVAGLSRELGMNYQMAFRSNGAAILIPSVVHWNVGHYAALVQRDGERLLVQDHTFRSSLWMTTEALEHEASGYFLVPSGPLPTGWRQASETEGKTVFGKGVTSSTDPNATTPDDQKFTDDDQKSCHGMPVYAIHALLISLNLSDTPVGYAPPVGPAVYFTATYNQKEANQPATFYYSNLGPKWTYNWLAYISDNPSSPNADVSFYANGGGGVSFTGFNPATQQYAVELMSQASLTKTSSSTYEMLYPDGSKKEFELSDGSVGTSRRVFLTKVVDPAGNYVQLKYDSQLRLTNITDAIGQATKILYQNPSSPYLITGVMDPFGRAAYFDYNPYGRLAQITDVIGLSSQLFYDTNDFINTLTTPYGTSTFATGATNGVIWLQATDPLGSSELAEYTQNQVLPSGDPSGAPAGMPVFNAYMYGRDSYYWNKKAFAEAAGDFTRAKIFHFLHCADGATSSRVLESVKEPLENRVWFDYPGQASPGFLGGVTLEKPSLIGRVLDDGTTQLYSYQYNIIGNITGTTDPVGRAFTFVYSTNAIDLTEVRMTHNGKNELQTRIGYNSQHLPLTITDASGQTTTNTFNSRGQVLATVNARSETNSFFYATNGYLLSLTGALQTTNDVVSFTYDGFGRVRTLTDTEGYTLTVDYDALDRVMKLTFPDNTTEQFVYDRLDLAASSDRLGRWTTNTYNALRQLTQVQDPLNRITSYSWCKCGSPNSLTDPMGRTTTWQYDLQGRKTSKTYVDGSTVTYIYENSTSRLKTRIDEKLQQTSYSYFADNTLAQISYANALVPTPSVSFTYDPDYRRVSTMQDGIGTTVYSYNPITASPILGAGRLASVSGPLPNSVATYFYDSLGRISSRSINGVAYQVSYDSLGRPYSMTNALGTFKYSYVNATPRLAVESYPNGQTNLYSYYNNVGDQRLKTILHLKPNGSLLSSFGYAYDSYGQIKYWTNQTDVVPSRFWSFAYDAANQLTNGVLTDGVITFDAHNYVYDIAGNRLQERSIAVTNQLNYNALNQLISVNPALTNSSYEWDAENRLTAINIGTHRSEFSYDGLWRRIKMTEKENGIITNAIAFLWCGSQICELRDFSGSAVSRRLFSQGENIPVGGSLTNYFYTKDHLGSIREALNQSGTLVTRYDYDPFGRLSVIVENLSTAFKFTGDVLHGSSGLYLTLYRALDSQSGRWTSRDPIGPLAGHNLYDYVLNDPVNLVDPFGLQPSGDSSGSCDSTGSSVGLGPVSISGNKITLSVGPVKLTIEPGGGSVFLGPAVSVGNAKISTGIQVNGNATVQQEDAGKGNSMNYNWNIGLGTKVTINIGPAKAGISSQTTLVSGSQTGQMQIQSDYRSHQADVPIDSLNAAGYNPP